jgi:hypothetical protein
MPGLIRRENQDKKERRAISDQEYSLCWALLLRKICITTQRDGYSTIYYLQFTDRGSMHREVE